MTSTSRDPPKVTMSKKLPVTGFEIAVPGNYKARNVERLRTVAGESFTADLFHGEKKIGQIKRSLKSGNVFFVVSDDADPVEGRQFLEWLEKNRGGRKAGGIFLPDHALLEALVNETYYRREFFNINEPKPTVKNPYARTRGLIMGYDVTDADGFKSFTFRVFKPTDLKTGEPLSFKKPIESLEMVPKRYMELAKDVMNGRFWTTKGWIRAPGTRPYVTKQSKKRKSGSGSDSSDSDSSDSDSKSDSDSDSDSPDSESDSSDSSDSDSDMDDDEAYAMDKGQEEDDSPDGSGIIPGRRPALTQNKPKPKPKPATASQQNPKPKPAASAAAATSSTKKQHVSKKDDKKEKEKEKVKKEKEKEKVKKEKEKEKEKKKKEKKDKEKSEKKDKVRASKYVLYEEPSAKKAKPDAVVPPAAAASPKSKA